MTPDFFPVRFICSSHIVADLLCAGMHSFCLDCLVKMVSFTNGSPLAQLKCPVCRSVTTFPIVGMFFAHVATSDSVDYVTHPLLSVIIHPHCTHTACTTFFLCSWCGEPAEELPCCKYRRSHKEETSQTPQQQQQ